MNNTISTDPDTGFTAAAEPSIAHAAKELRDAAEGKISQVLHTAEDKVRDAVQIAREKSVEIRERATSSAKHLRETAGTQAKQLCETATEQWDHTRVKAKEIQVTAEDYIRQNPTKCVLGALGAGFLIGLLVRR
jgi:ElaB/YqjD/DUF883 family membrane-anchored ribosome-binding protein